MSILIKGMCMPSMCSECEFCAGLIMPDGIYTCECPADSIHGKNITRAIDEDCRHPDCPLVEVPTPHGRLIDADAMEDRLGISDRDIYAKEEIREAPTVIEAEER